MYSLYSVLVLIVAVIASPWFIYQAVRYKKYVNAVKAIHSRTYEL